MEEKYNNKRNVIFNPNRALLWNEEKNTIVSTTPSHVDNLCAPFQYLKKNASDGLSSYPELEEAIVIVKKNNQAKIRKLKQEKQAGFIAVSTLTILGTIILTIIIFTITGNILNEKNEFKLGTIITVFSLPNVKKEIALFSIEGYDRSDIANLEVAYLRKDRDGYDYLEEIKEDSVLKEAMKVVRKIIKEVQ